MHGKNDTFDEFINIENPLIYIKIKRIVPKMTIFVLKMNIFISKLTFLVLKMTFHLKMIYIFKKLK